MKCDVCGHEFDGVDAAFCIYCGRRIIKPVSTCESGITERLDNIVEPSAPVMSVVQQVKQAVPNAGRMQTNNQPDSYYQKLPSIIEEMRSNESQIVKPLQWLLSCIMLYIPLIGMIYFMIASIRAKKAAKKNLKSNANKANFAKTAFIVSLCYLVLLGIGAFICVRMFVLQG